MKPVFVAAGLAAVALGCGSERRYGPGDNPTSVSDVTGVQFGWACSDRGCAVAPLTVTPAPDPCADPGAAGYSYTWGRFFEICSVCVVDDAGGVYWTSSPGQCRILACETDADCPAIYEYSPETAYGCVNGLCRSPDTVRFPPDTLDRTAVEQLCFAVHPRADTANPFSPATADVESLVEEACPGTARGVPCTLPGACRSP